MKLTLQDMMKIFKELLKGRFKITFPKFTIFSFHIFEHWSKRSPGPEIPCLPLFLGPSLSLCFLRLSWVVFDFIPSGLSSVWGGSPGCSVSSDSLQSSSHRPLTLTHSSAGQNPSWFQLLFLGLACHAFQGMPFDSSGTFFPQVFEMPHCFLGCFWPGVCFQVGFVALVVGPHPFVFCGLWGSYILL